MAVVTRLIQPADRARVLTVALNNKVQAQGPHPWTPTDALIGLYCYGEGTTNPTRCAVITNNAGMIMAWLAGCVWHEEDTNPSEDGVTFVHEKWATINRFAIHSSVTNAQIANNIAQLAHQLFAALNTFGVTRCEWPIMLGAIQQQIATALGIAGDDWLDDHGVVIAKRFNDPIAAWLAGFP